jgi:uncharacterized delta-60 repeat protein
MTRIAAAVSLFCLMTLSAGYSAYAAAGSLDPTFGTGGTVETNFGMPVIPSTVLLQSTGKIIVVAGFDNTPAATESFGVVRYRPQGILDTGFGTQGMSLANITNFINSPNAAAVQPDDKIVVAGVAQSADGTVSEFAVVRFNANGGLDSSFGTGGKVTTNFVGVQAGGVSNPAKVVLLQTDGKILVIGTASECAKCVLNTAWARYTSTGALDATFGTGGTQLTNLFGGPPNAAAELSNGDILTIAGSVIAQFSPSGSLRTAVTMGPIVATSVGGTNVFQRDGKYLLAQGATGKFGSRNPEIQIFRFEGGVDWAFANPPFDFGPVVAAPDFATAIVLQPDAKIVVGGTASSNASSESFGVARLNPDGSLDSTFGTGGTVTTTFSGAQAGITAVVLQPDGKIVAAGQAIRNPAGAVDLILARYLGQ